MKTLVVWMFLLTVPAAMALEVSFEYVLPGIVLIIFFILFFLLKNKLKEMIIPKPTQSKPRSSKPQRRQHTTPVSSATPVPRARPTSPPHSHRRKKQWRRDMKFTFTDFHSIQAKKHVSLSKDKESAFGKLNRVIQNWKENRE